MKKTGATLLLVAAVLAALILPFSDFGQSTSPPNLDRVLFIPTKFPTGDWDPNSLIFEDVFFHAADNTKLHGWYCPTKNAELTILIVHGNAGNVSTRVRLLQHLQNQQTASIFIFDYRGYGRSEGSPSIDGAMMDAQAARDKLEEVSGKPASEFILIGESIGGAIAVKLANSVPPKALILQSTFSNLQDLARIHYPLRAPTVPKHLLNSTDLLPSYQGPLLQSHGENDQIIPLKLGRKLFETAVGRKQFLTISEAGHNDWLTTEYLTQLDQFLGEFVSPPNDSSHCCDDRHENQRPQMPIQHVAANTK